MFTNPELKKLRQDVDALSEMVEKLIESQEVKHADVMNKLELLEAKLDQEGTDVTEIVQDIKSDIEEVRNVVESVESTLEK